MFNPKGYVEGSVTVELDVYLYYIELQIKLELKAFRITPLELQLARNLDRSNGCYSMGALTEVGDFSVTIGHRARECSYGVLGYFFGDLSEYIGNTETTVDPVDNTEEEEEEEEEVIEEEG